MAARTNGIVQFWTCLFGRLWHKYFLKFKTYTCISYSRNGSSNMVYFNQGHLKRNFTCVLIINPQTFFLNFFAFSCCFWCRLSKVPTAMKVIFQLNNLINYGLSTQKLLWYSERCFCVWKNVRYDLLLRQKKRHCV